MIRMLALALACIVVLALASCGEKEDRLAPSGAKGFELLLDWFPNADHAGIYAAKARGYFEDAGLDLKIRQPTDPAAPIKEVAAGRTDLAISYEPEVLRARDQGLPVVAVGALVQVPLTSIISLPKAGVRSPADLKGKTVGTGGIDYQHAYLQTILSDAGVEPSQVKERNVGFNLVPTLLTGKVDAVLGGYWNYEGVQLRMEKRRPRIIRLERVGVPTFNELVLVANEDKLEQDDDRLRAFVAALARGTRELRRRPDDAVDALLDANPDLEEKLQRAALKATLPHFFPPKGKPYGWQDPRAWSSFTAWMRDNGLLEQVRSASGAYTNELLPGAGL